MATTHAPSANAEHKVARFRSSEHAARTAAVLAAAGFLGLALFQVALTAGADWGHAAWGGANAELSGAQRIGSGVAVLVWTAAALAVLGRAGLVRSGRGPARLHRWGTWVVAAGSALGALANFASESRYENLILGPLALALALLCVVVARSQPE
ncbi:MAG TPA: hypothetical protein VD769_07710 [Gaiellaceae bacterium]|nr:hypothetical protein [Gaiellaceae bacterium]